MADITIKDDQVAGLIRTALATAAGYVAGKGWIDQQTALTVAGLAAAALVGVWSWVSNSLINKVTSLADSPDVKKIVTSQAIANAVPSNKVVPPS